MKILVIGSTNIDHVSYIETFPKIGETIKATKYMKNLGGKGANQAIALAKLSNNKNQVAFFSHIGQAEQEMIEGELAKYKVNCQYLFKSENLATGVANIFVSKLEKDNFIAVAALANDLFMEKAKAQLADAIKNHDAILLQLEINQQLIEEAILLAHKFQKTIFLNPSPIAELDTKLLKYIDWLILNETELEYLTSMNISNLNVLNQQIQIIKNYGVKNVIVTLGANGCYINSDKLSQHFKSKTKNINVIDSTGAGDAFTGAFVAQLNNLTQEKALDFAMRAAEYTIQHSGAQVSIPTYQEVKNAQT